MNIKKIEELAVELKDKRSWVEKGFESFLDKWSRETSGLQHDSRLDVVVFSERENDHDETSYQYCLVAGNNYLQKLDPVDFRYNRKTKAVYIHNCDIDMANLRKIISSLPERLSGYAKRLESVGKEYDGVLAILGHAEAKKKTI